MNVTTDFDVSGLGGVATIRTLASAATTTTDPSLRVVFVAKARAFLTRLEAEIAAVTILVSAQEREIARVAAAGT